MDRGAWWAIVHGVPKSQTQLKQLSACAHARTHTQEGTEPQRIHRVTVDFMGFSNIFKCQCQILGTASLERFLKAFFFFSERAVNRARNEDFTDRKSFLFFSLSLENGKSNPTPLEDLHTDVALPAHPHLLSPLQPPVASHKQLIPFKDGSIISLLHEVITSQRVFSYLFFKQLVPTSYLHQNAKSQSSY